jgi:hypothetical protein
VLLDVVAPYRQRIAWWWAIIAIIGFAVGGAIAVGLPAGWRPRVIAGVVIAVMVAAVTGYVSRVLLRGLVAARDSVTAAAQVGLRWSPRWMIRTISSVDGEVVMLRPAIVSGSVSIRPFAEALAAQRGCRMVNFELVADGVNVTLLRLPRG